MKNHFLYLGNLFSLIYRLKFNNLLMSVLKSIQKLFYFLKLY